MALYSDFKNVLDVQYTGKAVIYFLYDTNNIIGYNDGNPVSTIRVELTASGIVHSHPRFEL